MPTNMLYMCAIFVIPTKRGKTLGSHGRMVGSLRNVRVATSRITLRSPVCDPKTQKGSDDSDSGESVPDIDLAVSSANLNEALATRIGGRRRNTEVEEEAFAAGEQDHFQNSQSAILRGETVYGPAVPHAAEGPRRSIKLKDIQAIKEAARKSRKCSDSIAKGGLPPKVERPPSLVSSWAPTIAAIDKWVRQSPDKYSLNKEQMSIIHIIAQRITQDLRDEQEHSIGTSEPLVWLLHGRPGTGKTHVLKAARKLFED